MKTFTFFFLLILFCKISIAQTCNNPVSSTIFQNNFNQIAIQQTNDLKLAKADLFVNSNCVLSSQVKNIAQLFTEDNYRLEFCKTAYPHTFDQVNFFDVYDAFTTFSYALRLYDFIHTAPVIVTPPPVSTEPVFPNVAYPSSANYTGKKGCAGPVLNAASFKTVAQNVFIQPTDESKQIAIQNASNNNCLDFAEVMKLVSLLQSEDFRLQLLEFTFPKVDRKSVV